MGLKEFTSGSLPFTTPQPLNSSSKVLLLVHGLFSCPSKCWSSLISKIQKETNPSYTNIWTFGYKTSLSISQNAQILANALSTYYANGTQIDIVAHSMGGLVSRSMIEQCKGSAYIDKLITLDTPHQGTPTLAVRLALGAIVGLIDPMVQILVITYTTPAIKDLNSSSDYIKQMMTMQNHPYYAITSTNNPLAGISGSGVIPGLDDGIVSVASATGVLGAVSPASIVNIPKSLAHIYVTENDSIYGQLLSYLKGPSDNSIIFNPNLTYGTMTDIDGNVYKTIQIGTQTWMAENLKTTHYRNGDLIPKVSDNIAWTGLTSGAYCWNNNNEISYKSLYGALYNWYAISSTQNIAPLGWHIPSDVEVASLITYLGGESLAGSQMKESGNTHWFCPADLNSSNSSGFTGLPGGFRNSDGSFNSHGGGTWWSSSQSLNSNADAMYWLVTCNTDIASRGAINKNTGFSVRCIKD